MASIYVREDAVLPERRFQDHYPTADETVERGLDFLAEEMARLDPFEQPPNRLWAPHVLDPGSGDGTWGKLLQRRWPNARLVGVELREVERPKEYDWWIVGDFLGLPPLPTNTGFNLVIGNPPYRDAEMFLRRSLDLLTYGGFLVFLLRLTFLESQRRGNGLFRDYPPLSVAVCKKRPSFSGNGKTSPDAYMIGCWLKGFTGETRLTWI